MSPNRLTKRVNEVLAWAEIEKDRQMEIIRTETSKRLASLRQGCEHQFSKWHERHDENVLGNINTTYVRKCTVCLKNEVVDSRPDGEVITTEHVWRMP